jgi:hypothetical protein
VDRAMLMNLLKDDGDITQSVADGDG